MLDAVLDYDDAGPNPKHDPRKKPGPGGKPWLQQISYASILINLSLNNNRKNSLSTLSRGFDHLWENLYNIAF